MFISRDNIVEVNQAAVDTLAALASAAFDSSERLCSLNLQTARTIFDDSIAHGRSLATAHDLGEAWAISADLGASWLEKARNYSRNLFEISAQMQEKLMSIGGSQQAVLGQSFGILLDRLVRMPSVSAAAGAAALSSTLPAGNSSLSAVDSAFVGSARGKQQRNG